MPIMVVTFPEVAGLDAKRIGEFVLSLFGHRVFIKNRANGKARDGIRAALAKMDGLVMKLAAEPDYACLAVAADKPEHEVYEVNPANGQQQLKGYEEGYQLTGFGLDVFMPVIDAICNAVEETAEVAKPEPKPAEAAPPALASVP